MSRSDLGFVSIINPLPEQPVPQPVYFSRSYAPSTLALVARGTTPTTSQIAVTRRSLNFNPVEAFDAPAPGAVPSGWSCNGRDGFEDVPGEFYGDGACDCGCGVVDVDCASNSVSACEFDFCSGSQTINPNNIRRCQ